MPGKGRPFQKGHKFGKGRPRKEQCYADIARTMLSGNNIDITITFPTGKQTNIGLKATESFRHAMIAGLIREALKGNVHAAKELMDRTDGKVTDKLFLEDGSRLEIVERLVDVKQNND